jgi:Zn-dependent M28 family amino/carboxypeptidase
MRFSRLIVGSFLFAVVLAAAGLAARSGVAAPDRAEHIAPHEFDPQITAADFSTHVQVLASDAFGGRAPDTDGEEKSVQYVRAMFQQLGLQPGNGDSYFQTVPVVASVLDMARSRVDVTSPRGTRALKLGDEAIVASSAGRSEVSIDHSAIVFAGYGIDAPEQGWNDYAGVDVAGKTVIVLIGAPATFGSVTYYARAAYKFEEAARKGAAAVLVMHDARESGYEWDYLKARWSGVQFDLRGADDPQPTPPLRGWISAHAADSLFESAGKRVRDLRALADKRGFAAQRLGDLTLGVTIESSIVEGESRNVIAKIPGTKYPDEAVIYSAHWDHLGTHADGARKQIFNGAVDNATGVAAVLEIAAKYAADEPKPERSIVFLVPTLEESGLLGSKYYTAHPAVPLAKTVADINFDALVAVGPARDFVVVGLGMSELDEWVRPSVARRQRTLAGEARSDKDNFFRSDHLSFARAGVPVLFMRGGTQSTSSRGDAYALWNAYGKRYHTPADRFDPEWDLRGIVEDLDIAYEVGRKLASSREWPNYRDGNAFRALRDASRAGAAAGRSGDAH